ncbi:MAG: PD-(D/E)XK nuclease family protein, partial [Oscillospiraceae bacterium]
AHEHLFVSYPVTEETGEPLQPSALYLRARALARPTALPTMPLVQTAASAERALAILAGSDTPYTATLRALCERVLPSGRVARIERAACRIPHHLAQREVARRLFGKRLRLSPSRLERYYQCPFSYFIQDGLGLRALRKAELSPLETGTLVHRVLERMVSSHGGKGLSSLSEEDIRVEITQETDAYLAERLIDSGALTRRMRYAFAQLGDWLVELIVRLGKEFSQSEFEPVAFEMPIRAGAEVTPLVLQTVDGGEVLVEGTVDRVDVAMVNGERYVRVVDYKSGGKSFRLTDVYYGLNMQMLVYLFSIWKNGQGALSGLLPAGILYLPALGRYHTASRADAPEKVEKECQKHYRMNGLLLSDPQVLHAMEADGKGVFLPVRAGQEKSDALATLAEMGKLCRLVEKRVRDVARLLADGEIPARPVRRKNENPCTRCDWHGVCGFEEGDETRELIELDRDQLWKEEDDV